MGFPKEGIRLAKEALDIYRRLNDPVEQTQCPIVLARLLCGDKRFDAAERAMSRAMALILGLGKPDQFLACRSHRVLGYIYIDPRARQGKLFAITGWPLELCPPSAGTTNCFGFT